MIDSPHRMKDYLPIIGLIFTVFNFIVIILNSSIANNIKFISFVCSSILASLLIFIYIKYSQPTGWKYYGFKDVMHGKVFQDFSSDRIVYMTWADPCSNMRGHFGGENAYVKASVVNTTEDGNFLHISFRRQGWGTNIGLRAQNERALKGNFKLLKIRFRSPDNIPVGFAVRVVDANGRHWAFGPQADIYHLNDDHFNRASEWKDTVISLEDNLKWWHFGYDGFALSPQKLHPDFSVIPVIILEIGEPATDNVNCHNMTKFKTNSDERNIDIKSIEMY